MHPLAAPPQFGRGAIILPGQPIPEGLDAAPVFAITPAIVRDYNPTIQQLHRAWASRQPVVIELDINTYILKEPEALTIPLWEVDIKWSFPKEQLKFLIWANNADYRHLPVDGTTPATWEHLPGNLSAAQRNIVQPDVATWWHAVRAINVPGFERVSRPDEPGDIKLKNGRFAWIDGGPRGFGGLLTAQPTPGEGRVAHNDQAQGGDRETGMKVAGHAVSSGFGVQTMPGEGGFAGNERVQIGDRQNGTNLALSTALPSDLILLHRQDTERGQLLPMGITDSQDTQLSPDQQAAVNASQGAVRVIAPAGSGKTRVLTARITMLLQERNVPANRILALVYNNRAAKELRERVNDPNININTVHAWALNILRRHYPQIRVLEEWQVRRAISSIVDTTRQANVDPLKIWINIMAFTSSNLANPSEVEAEFAEEVPHFASVLTTYREMMRSAYSVDFNEMVYWAVELLLTNPEIRAQEQALADVVLVDEFQDLTPLYMLFIRLLAAPELQVFGVGDDDQVIYGFGGADPEFLINFDQYFPGSITKPLTINYRCPQPVVDAANKLLGNNSRRVSKEIHPTSTAAALPISYHNITIAKQGAAIGTIVQNYIDEGSHPRDIAVLSRITIRLLPVLAALYERKIPVNSPFNPKLLTRTGIKTVLAYLRIGCQPDRVAALDIGHIVHKPLRAIPGTVKQSLPHVASLDQLMHAPFGLTSRQLTAWQSFITDLRDLAKRCRTQPTAEVVRFIIDDLDVGSIAKSLENLEEPLGESGLTSHIDDLEVLQHVAHSCPKPGEFEEYLAKLLTSSSDGNTGVTLSTVHKVKGLEWPHVLVTAVFEGVMPHRLAETPAMIEEERRVFHVAITRASKTLDIVQPDTVVSRFAREMQGRKGTFTAANVAAGQHATLPATPGTPTNPHGQRASRKRQGQSNQRPSVTAAMGLKVVLPGGIRAEVIHIDEQYVQVQTRSGSILRVNYGETINVDDTRRVLCKPGR